MTRRIGVFCGSSDAVAQQYLDAGYAVGAAIARSGMGVVYGGGGTGLMGTVAQGALDAGGDVIGVIPTLMVEREWMRRDLPRLDIVDTMHERKASMAAQADAFLALPGGIGTLEEIFEVWTWRHVGYHNKPVGLLDVGGFWQPMLQALHRMADEGMIADAALAHLLVSDDVDQIVHELQRQCEQPAAP